MHAKTAAMTKITHLLEAAAAGDHQAAADLLPLVYDELRKLAAARMAAEKPGHTLDATALVHEAYLRLIGDQHFDGRGHFFAAAAEAMRRMLVNHARDRNRLKRGGGRRRVDLDRLTGPATATDDDLLETRRRPRPPGAGVPRRRRTGEAAVLRRDDAGRRGRRHWASRAEPPTGTGVSPGPGSRTLWPAGNSRNLRIPWRTTGPNGALEGGIRLRR